MLILVFSTMLYHYIKISIYETVVHVLNKEAMNTSSSADIVILYNKELGHIPVKVAVVENIDDIKKPKYTKREDSVGSHLVLEYPKGDKLIVVSTDTSFYDNLIEQILTNIIILNSTMIFLIIFYALFLSRSLLIPVKKLSSRLSKLNETVLDHIDESGVPEEFKPLARGINRLIDRIRVFVGYQKELFIGIAHELKTPLAVMKTKNEVTLLKPRESEKYIEALKSNNASIDAMNKMISSILEIGRQEGAQFEEPVTKEMIEYTEEICKNLKIIAKNQNVDITTRHNAEKFYMKIQPNLFLHIIQNFIQNAIKFSKPGSAVLVRSRVTEECFRIDVMDEGKGIDESLDLFAPFKRYGDEGGAGLGLFLAKGAADAMNAKISIKNREDKNGAIATIRFPISGETKKLNKEEFK
ncbi:MAG: HAMP domain-containing histidine kinase [Campylobacteraceae bacterium]|nr:HAMP domain-containing histidine kinase [Campylobacteraceae bacterium]